MTGAQLCSPVDLSQAQGSRLRVRAHKGRSLDHEQVGSRDHTPSLSLRAPPHPGRGAGGLLLLLTPRAKGGNLASTCGTPRGTDHLL